MTKKKIRVPLVGRVTRLRRTWWFAYVPAIGAAAEAASPRDAVSALKGNIERMFRHDREPVIVTVSVLGATVKDGAKVSVTCDRRGLLEARAAEFKRLLADADGPVRNPYIVPIRRGDFLVANEAASTSCSWPGRALRAASSQRRRDGQWMRREAFGSDVTSMRRMPRQGSLSRLRSLARA